MHPLVMYEIAKGRIADRQREAEAYRLAHPWDDVPQSDEDVAAGGGRRSRIAGFVAILTAVRGRVTRPAGAAGTANSG